MPVEVTKSDRIQLLRERVTLMPSVPEFYIFANNCCVLDEDMSYSQHKVRNGEIVKVVPQRFSPTLPYDTSCNSLDYTLPLSKMHDFQSFYLEVTPLPSSSRSSTTTTSTASTVAAPSTRAACRTAANASSSSLTLNLRLNAHVIVPVEVTKSDRIQLLRERVTMMPSMPEFFIFANNCCVLDEDMSYSQHNVRNGEIVEVVPQRFSPTLPYDTSCNSLDYTLPLSKMHDFQSFYLEVAPLPSSSRSSTTTTSTASTVAAPSTRAACRTAANASSSSLTLNLRLNAHVIVPV
ncbi:hypothetical protein Pyn_22531 [Prunus yedoensis var. nudiflora]|uniref:Ubiquitin-like domain-containing protein n=1 Tax=Prunus yedoensis var. nudiflora TaxID=2094558 RepID=A0A314ZNG6_PRUYE|nr:hypothetical protein Pyn_22531 [Prunus yedoensis var. nudiflora]